YWAKDNAGNYSSSQRLRVWVRSGSSSDGSSSDNGSSDSGSTSGSASGDGSLSSSAPSDSAPSDGASAGPYLYYAFVPGLRQDE
ncbi:MAG: hypothetical protein OXJ55_02695, partial [Caldilineaceae bacterium]|nr:hypothetical protein [Caldilineaceae bacterium]